MGVGAFTQDNRNIKLTTPLGVDVLLVTGFRGREQLSSPFRFELDLVSLTPVAALADLLGQPVTLSVRLADGSWRPFHGRVSRFLQGSRNAQGITTFRAELVPWLWFLNLTTDCLIFQDLSPQEIITQIFEEHGFADFEFRGLSGGQEKRPYCVQYRESAFNFISRLLEEEGIWYYFEHMDDKHLLVLADTPSQHPPCPHQALVKYEQGSASATRSEDVVLEALWCEEVQPGRVAFNDFNFEMPSTPLAVELASEQAYEVYDFPGRYANRSRGDALARLKLEELTAATRHLEGSSTCRDFSPGYYFELKGYLRQDVEPAQVLGSVFHEGHQSLGSLMGEGGDGFHYRNTFTSFPRSVPYRPPTRARKPVVQGTQTAVVVGKSGEEIWTDEYGRVKVQFHWDRRGQMDENSSCWVRVAHHWAGKQWGALFLPRIGQEVIVDFLEGDPDRPIIIGRVYNAEHMPPYTLPDDQTKSTIKSDSSKGGNGFNELRFEDKAGEEEVFLQAQKDMNVNILNDHSRTVGANESVSVGGSQSISVGGDRSITVQKNQTITIEGSQNITINGAQGSGGVNGGSMNITGDYKLDASNTIDAQAPTHILLTCGGSSILIEPGKITLTAGGGSSITLDGNAFTISSGGSSILLDANACMASSGGSQVLLDANAAMASSGGSAVTLDANAEVASSGGSSVVLDASATMTGTATATVGAPQTTISGDAKAELVGGGGSVTADPSGVSVTGPMVKLN